MSRLFKRLPKPVAQAPGTLEFTGPQLVDRVQIEVVDYDGDQIQTTVVEDARSCAGYRDTPTVTWINVVGLHDIELIRELGELFGVHPLVLEDIVSPHQRPRMDDDDHLYVVCRMMQLLPEVTSPQTEQLSLIVGHGYLISFQERPGDVFAPVRERLHRGRTRIRTSGADYLAYCLLDAVVDHYLLVAEAFGEAIEDLENRLLAEEIEPPLGELHGLRRELTQLRRSVWPMREIISGLTRSDSALIDASTVPFLRDVNDHIDQVNDAIETFRDMLDSLHELTTSIADRRLNDVMKVLTIFASIFVPLTFVAGVYGMNFQHMPELGWRWAYPVFWGVILVMGGGMLVYFRRKKWL